MTSYLSLSYFLWQGVSLSLALSVRLGCLVSDSPGPSSFSQAQVLVGDPQDPLFLSNISDGQ